jgi:hypothetical protein
LRLKANRSIGVNDFKPDFYRVDASLAMAEKVSTAPTNPVPAGAAEMRQAVEAVIDHRLS